MVDSEKLSLCCSDEGRYLLLGAGRVEGVEQREKPKKENVRDLRQKSDEKKKKTQRKE